MIKWFHSIAFVVVFNCASAQIHVDRPIILVGPDPTDRQFTGIPPPSAPGDALAAGVSQTGELRTITNATSNSWVATLPGIVSNIEAGLHVVVRTPVTTAGPVSLTVNEQGPFPVMRGNISVDGTELEIGTMASLIFDGSSMQLINGRHDRIRNCPSGMVAGSTQFCIETEQRPASDFFAAAVSCASAGRRLCTWSEFHLGCANGAFGLTGATDNWEWSNNTANEDNTVRIVGSGSCMNSSTWPATGSAPLQFRCCYSR